MDLRRAAMLLAAVVTATSPSACRRKDAATARPPVPKPRLGPVAIEDVTPEDSVAGRLDLEACERGLREKLLATGLFATPGADAGTAAVVRLRATMAVEAVEVGAKGELQARIRLHADTRPSEAPGAIAFTLEGRAAEGYAVPAPVGGRPAERPSPSAMALRVAGDLVSGFAVRQRLIDGPPSVVHAALVGDGGELREEAIRAVGARQLRDEAPTLLKLLSDPEEPIRDAALGALIELKDRRAVTELTRSRSLRDRREMRKILEAISILGGQEAEEYLSFVAATHDDEEIRSAATAARMRLNRRQGDGARPPPQPGQTAN
jgi:hypothetical protein